MSGFLRKLFGSPPPRKPVKRALVKRSPAKTYSVGKLDRAAVIAEAMQIYRRQQAKARGVLEKAVAEFRAKPPSPLADREGMERLLALRQAELDLGRLFAHDLKRFLVLAGIRQWLGEEPARVQVPVVPSPPKH